MLVPAVPSTAARTALPINARPLAASAELTANVTLEPVAPLTAARPVARINARLLAAAVDLIVLAMLVPAVLLTAARTAKDVKRVKRDAALKLSFVFI